MQTRYTQRYTVLALVLVVALLVVWGPLPGSAQAQGGLGEDEQALLDRVAGAMNGALEYESFTVNATQSSYNELVLMLGEQSLTLIEDSTETTTERRVRLGDTFNLQADVVFEYSASDSQAGDMAYTLEGEVRYVDDVLYINVVRDNPDDALLDPLPEGWFVWESGAVAALDDWNPEAFTEALGEGGLFSYLDLIMDKAQDVTLEAVELDDGTPVDQITIEIQGVVVGEVLQEQARREGEERLVFNVFSEVDPASAMIFTFLLDDDDMVRGLDGMISMVWDDLDLSLLNEEAAPGQGIVDWTIENTLSQVNSNINEAIEPVAAPDVVEME